MSQSKKMHSFSSCCYMSCTVCGEEFPLPNNAGKRYIIEEHMLKNKVCSQSVFQCEHCNHYFLKKEHFIQHVTRKAKCLETYQQIAKDHNVDVLKLCLPTVLLSSNKKDDNKNHIDNTSVVATLTTSDHTTSMDNYYPFNSNDDQSHHSFLMNDKPRESTTTIYSSNIVCTSMATSKKKRSKNNNTQACNTFTQQRQNIFQHGNDFVSPNKKRYSSQKINYEIKGKNKLLTQPQNENELHTLRQISQTTSKREGKAKIGDKVFDLCGNLEMVNSSTDDTSTSSSNISDEELSRMNDSMYNGGTNIETLMFGGTISIDRITNQVVCTYKLPQQELVNNYNKESLRDTYKKKKKELYKMKNQPMDNIYLGCMQCICLILKKNLPLTDYKDFITLKYETPRTHYSLQQLIDRAVCYVYGETLYKRLLPKTYNLECPSGRKVTVVTFDVIGLITEMFSDTNFTCMENMIFTMKNGNPFDWEEEDYFGDFNTSTYYNETAKKLCINKKREVLAPIILYMDHFVMDAFGKLGLEPVTMSLMIYNKRHRRRLKTWKVIGYMPNLDLCDVSRQQKTAKDNYNDTHHCLSYILSGIRKIQEQGGLRWKFFLKETQKHYERVVHFPLGLVIGDTKSNNLLCGHYSGNSKMKFISRMCTCKLEDASKFNATCHLVKMNDIACLTEKELHNLSYRKIEPMNAFHAIDFGANIYGINIATPAEPLHQFLLGTIETLYDSFLFRLKPDTKNLLGVFVRNISRFCGNQGNKDFLNVKTFNRGLFEAKRLSGREKISKIFVIYLVLITRGFRERVVGQTGYQPEAKTKKDIEKKGLTYIFKKQIEEEEFNNWIVIFEETLLLYSWIYCGKHKKLFFQGGKNCLVAMKLKQYMRMLNNYAPNYTGNGYNTYKNHSLLHYWFDVKMWGEFSNFCSMVLESTHKIRKNNAKHTQKRHSLIDVQTGIQEVKRNMLLKAIDMTPKDNGILSSSVESDISILQNIESMFLPMNRRGREERTFVASGSKFIIHARWNHEEDYNHCTKIPGAVSIQKDEHSLAIWLEWKNKEINNCGRFFPQRIMHKICSILMTYNDKRPGYRVESIHGFTELKIIGRETETIRACPQYRHERHWFDWIYVYKRNSNGEIYVGQTLMFLDFRSVIMKDMSDVHIDEDVKQSDYLLESLKRENKFFVLAHMTDSQINNDKEICLKNRSLHNDSNELQFKGLIYSYHTMIPSTKTYTYLSSLYIQKGALVFHEQHCQKETSVVEPGLCEEIILLKDYSDWPAHFINYEDECLIQKATDTQQDISVINHERKLFEA